MGSFGDVAVAAEFRDYIEKIVSEQVKKLAPPSRVAKVLDVNQDTLTARVQFAGDTGAIKAHFSPNLMPKTTDALVRVAGGAGNFYITEIINETGAHSDYEPLKLAYDAGDFGTDGLAPTNATTVTAIGGIGSMFFRWTEIANADPVTYRLHVNAGSAPATDGTNQVASGVGLTFASVRKLADGTAIVADGSVTYYAIVTVEDADGAGPASATVTGVPAQVTGPDIAASVVTADLLLSNDAFIGALTSVDVKADSVQVGTAKWNSTDGFVIPGVATFPASGAASSTLDSLGVNTLTAVGQVSLRSTLNELSKGAKLTLQAGTQPPTSAPTVVTDWEIWSPDSALTKLSPWHFTSDGTYLYWLSASGHIWRGNMDGTTPIDLGLASTSWQSIVKIGTYFYGASGNNTTSYQLQRVTLSGTTITQGSLTNIGSAVSTGMAVSYVVGPVEGDTTKLLVAWRGTSGYITWDTVTISTAATTRTTTTTTISSSSGIKGVWSCTAAVGPTYGFSGARTVLSTMDSSSNYVFSGTAIQNNENWATSAGLNYSRFIATDGTYFIEYNNNNANITRYTNDLYNANVYRTVSMTWYLSGTPDQETVESPRTTYYFAHRKRTTISYPAGTPSGLTGARFYLGRSTTSALASGLARTSMWLQFANADPSTPTLAPVPVVTSGSNPPASSTFTDSSPAIVQSADGKTYIDALGKAAIPYIMPPGGIVMYGGTSAPAGFLLCNGQSVSTTTYADLFAAIGYAYGGSGASFNLPDLRQRFPLGPGTTYAIGANELGTNPPGAEGNANRMSHSHNHSISGVTGADATAQAGTGQPVTSRGAFNGHNHGGSTGTDNGLGAGSVHAHVTVNFIIKF